MLSLIPKDIAKQLYSDLSYETKKSFIECMEKNSGKKCIICTNCDYTTHATCSCTYTEGFTCECGLVFCPFHAAHFSWYNDENKKKMKCAFCSIPHKKAKKIKTYDLFDDYRRIDEPFLINYYEDEDENKEDFPFDFPMDEIVCVDERCGDYRQVYQWEQLCKGKFSLPPEDRLLCALYRNIKFGFNTLKPNQRILKAVKKLKFVEEKKNVILNYISIIEEKNKTNVYNVLNEVLSLKLNECKSFTVIIKKLSKFF